MKGIDDGDDGNRINVRKFWAAIRNKTTPPTLKYREGFLYQLAETISFETQIRVKKPVGDDFVTLFPSGNLVLIKGFAWDGASGTTKWITGFLGKFGRPGKWLKSKWLKTIHKGSAAHDGLYRMMRKGLLDLKWRPITDITMLDICRKSGMTRPRLWALRVGLKKFAKFAAMPENKKEILTAP